MYSDAGKIIFMMDNLNIQPSVAISPLDLHQMGSGADNG